MRKNALFENDKRFKTETLLLIREPLLRHIIRLPQIQLRRIAKRVTTMLRVVVFAAACASAAAFAPGALPSYGKVRSGENVLQSGVPLLAPFSWE